MNLDITEKWAKEIALMSDADFEENCKHIETLLNRRKQALRIHDVSGSLCEYCKDDKKAVCCQSCLNDMIEQTANTQ